MEWFKMYKGQMFENLGLVDHVSPDGTVRKLVGWFTHCAECGKPILVKTTTVERVPTRRCPVHAKKGGRI